MSRRSWSVTASAVSSSRCTPRSSSARRSSTSTSRFSSVASRLHCNRSHHSFVAPIHSRVRRGHRIAGSRRAQRRRPCVGRCETPRRLPGRRRRRLVDGAGHSTPDELMATVESVLPAVDACLTSRLTGSRRHRTTPPGWPTSCRLPRSRCGTATATIRTWSTGAFRRPGTGVQRNVRRRRGPRRTPNMPPGRPCSGRRRPSAALGPAPTANRS